MGTVTGVEQGDVLALLTSLTHNIDLPVRATLPYLQSILEQTLGTIQQNPACVALLSQLFEHEEALLHHSFHVTVYALAIASKTTMSTNELQQLALAALLHDIGKISVRAVVLNKPGKLTGDEFEEIKAHTVWGLRYLQAYTTYPRCIQEVVVQHHERLDGSGYPNHLTADQIHPWAKIVAVSDVYDALTAERCYKKAMSYQEALNILQQEAVNKLDAHYVSLLASSIKLD